MNYYIISSSDREPASNEMIVWLVVLPTPCLEGFCQQASSVSIWSINLSAYCARNEPLVLRCGVGGENLMLIVDQTSHAWESIPHVMKFSDHCFIVQGHLLTPLDIQIH